MNETRSAPLYRVQAGRLRPTSPPVGVGGRLGGRLHPGRPGRDVPQSPLPDLAPVSWAHWWTEPRTLAMPRAGLTIDQAKAACIFEGLRRRPEVARAVAARKLPEGWQVLTGLAWAWWSESWADLHTDQQARLLNEMRRPCYLPPIGYSVFPQDDAEAQRRASYEPLVLPPEDDCDGAVAFVAKCRRLQAAGFAVGAVDCKTSQAIRYAAAALTDQPRTVRAADLVVRTCHAHRETPTGARHAAQSEVEVLGHVRAGDGWRAECHFDWVSIVREFEAVDAGHGGKLNFIPRLRL